MKEWNFYEPEEVRPMYEEIVPAYRAAFAGEPWYEVSKCADPLLRCAGGLSSVAVGSQCELCELRPERPAYEPGELAENFDAVANAYPTSWYIERNEKNVALAAIVWRAKPKEIAEEKYADVPEMQDWMETRLGREPIVWLDEVFANKDVQTSGNLWNFAEMCRGFISKLGGGTMAYRTINEKMTEKAKKSFGSAEIFARGQDVPDRRDFVIIGNNDNNGEA